MHIMKNILYLVIGETGFPGNNVCRLPAERGILIKASLFRQTPGTGRSIARNVGECGQQDAGARSAGGKHIFMYEFKKAVKPRFLLRFY